MVPLVLSWRIGAGLFTNIYTNILTSDWPGAFIPLADEIHLHAAKLVICWWLKMSIQLESRNDVMFFLWFQEHLVLSILFPAACNSVL